MRGMRKSASLHPFCNLLTAALWAGHCQRPLFLLVTLVLAFCRQNLRAVKEGRVAIVDGNQMFARPGPRLVDALEFLVGLLHNSPALIPADFPWTWWDTQQATLAESTPVSTSVHTSGRADKSTADSSSQMANDSNSHIANGNMLQNGSSSGKSYEDTVDSGTSLPDECDSTSQSKGGKQAAEKSGSTHPGTCDKTGQQAAGQAGTTLKDSDISTAGPEAAERKWGAAPFLGPEIEEAHAAAIDAGQPTYTDPATGYKVAVQCTITHKG